jgi:hypothetical protein
MQTHTNTLFTTHTDIISYEDHFSTAQIEEQIFYSELSPSLSPSQEEMLQGQFKLIGDELMRIDKENLPPGVPLPSRDISVFKLLSE